MCDPMAPLALPPPFGIQWGHLAQTFDYEQEFKDLKTRPDTRHKVLQNSFIREGITGLRTDGLTDRRTDGRTDGQTDRRTDICIPRVLSVSLDGTNKHRPKSLNFLSATVVWYIRPFSVLRIRPCPVRSLAFLRLLYWHLTQATNTHRHTHRKHTHTHLTQTHTWHIHTSVRPSHSNVFPYRSWIDDHQQTQTDRQTERHTHTHTETGWVLKSFKAEA